MNPTPSPDGPVHTGTILNDSEGIILAPLDRVLDLADPLTSDPWGIGRVHASDLSAPRRHTCRSLFAHPGSCRGCHLTRIEDFILSGPLWDDPHPITLDVGLENFRPWWPLLDGNHRVAAAALSGDSHITVSVMGDWDHAIALLNVELPSTSEMEPSCH